MLEESEWDEWVGENFGNVWALRDLMESQGGKSLTAGLAGMDEIDDLYDRVFLEQGDEAADRLISWLKANPGELDCDVLRIEDGVLKPYCSFGDILRELKPKVVLDHHYSLRHGGRKQPLLDDIACNDCSTCAGAMFCSEQKRTSIRYDKEKLAHIDGFSEVSGT